MDGPISETSLLDFDPRSPFRPVDWRWRLANHLVERRLRPRRRWVDGWVRRAARFRRAAARLGDPAHPELVKVDPDVAAANWLRNGADPDRRLVAEAGLLSGEGYDAVAARCGLRPGAAEAYGRLFYDVVDNLHARDWVVCVCLPGLHDHTRGPDLATAVKAFAFAGGPHVLDAVLHAAGLGLAPPGYGISPSRALWAELALEVKRLPVGGEAVSTLLNLAALLGEVKSRGAGDGHRAVIQPLVLRPVDVKAEASSAGGPAVELSLDHDCGVWSSRPVAADPPATENVQNVALSA